MSKALASINWALGGALFLLAMVQPATQSFSQTTTVEFPKTGENVVLVSSGWLVTFGFVPAELLGWPSLRRSFSMGRSLHWAHEPGKTFSDWNELNTDDLGVFQEATRQKALAVLTNPRSATDPAECHVTTVDDVRSGLSFWGLVLLLGVILAAVNLARVPTLRRTPKMVGITAPAPPQSLREHVAASIRAVRHFSFHRDHAPSHHHPTPWHVRLHNASRKGREGLSAAFSDLFKAWRVRSGFGNVLRDWWYKFKG